MTEPVHQAADDKDGGRRWYVVHTQPHREARAEAHLGYQGFRTFLPLHCKTVRHARQFRTVKAPFFPRYLFVQIDVARDRWRSVAGTVGVSHLIMEGERPKPIASDVVLGLIGATNPAGVISLESALRPGQAVRIATGPFSGFIGELATLDDDGRVKVLLDIMGTRVALRAESAGLVPIA